MALKKIDKTTQNNVAILAAHGASVTKISKQTGLHHTSVKKVLQEPSVIALKKGAEEQLAELFAETANRALKKITDEKLESSNAQQLGVLAGICTDKSRLLSNKSTDNVSVFFQIVQESDRAD